MGNQKHISDAQRERNRDKRAARGSGGPVSTGWQGFINWTPSADERTEFDAWAMDVGLYWFEVVNRAVEDGFKLSLKYDARSSAFMAMFTHGDERDERYGIALTMRGPTPEAALMRLAWAHQFKIAGRYVEYFQMTARGSDLW